MKCPKCSALLHCSTCSHPISALHLLQSREYFEAPECEECRERHEREIDRHKKKIATLRQELEEQQSTARSANSKVSERLAFLKFQDPDSTKEIFKGDVTFVLQGRDVIHAHRFVLAGKSSVFCRMFDCGMLEDKTGVIPIDDATYPVMRAVINYCYTADITFTDEVPPAEVLKVAHKYEITYLRDVCAEELCGRIDEKNTLEMLKLSKSYEAKALPKASAKYFKKNFNTVLPILLESM